MTLRIFGAGMSGLMAAQMMRRHQPIVSEAQTKLPDNHGALLRFRSNIVGKAVGQKLLRVDVQKAIMVGGQLRDCATLADANRYSLKVSGEAMGRSVLNLSGGERWIAPEDFIAALADNVPIQYGLKLTSEIVKARNADSEPLISTIPMPALAQMVGWDGDIDFRYKPIWSVKATISRPATRLYQTIYYPEHERWYRASITGDQLIIEYPDDPGEYVTDHVHTVAMHFGFKSELARSIPFLDPKLQKFGKLLPVDEEQRRSFILAMSDRYNIYSLGRFATWRQILLDDVVHDIEVIENFITQRSNFSRRKHYGG